MGLRQAKVQRRQKLRISRGNEKQRLGGQEEERL